MKRTTSVFCLLIAVVLGTGGFSITQAAAPAPIRALFLGDNGPHKPADRFKQLQPALASRGIELTYTDKLDDLNAAKLGAFDALIIYANHTRISPAQERALLEYVASGHGFVPLHCASYCFLNSPKYIELVGGQFKSHGAGVFKETIVSEEHPITKGLQPIESWDESYVHTKHNTNRLVLAERRDAQGNEPYTWVREVGKGRVFYTAWGHDERTWGNAQFIALVERGLRWAAAAAEPALKPREGLAPLPYTNASSAIPNYIAGARWGTIGEAYNQMQLPLTSEESAKRIVVPPGFEAKLWAAEPQIVKPICMAWDERGRLWIAETLDYPNELKSGDEGRDQIKICEDTDGDGRADKFTVFADRLSIPTGMVFANGGLILTVGGDTLLLKDTDGDDKADVREVLFTGWNMGDTHATASNLRYGFDNWIWGTVGYSGFDGEVGGKRVRFGQGVFRFKPDGSAIEFVRSSNNNTWGLGLTEDNIVFGSTANNNASFYMPIPNRYYEAVLGWSASRMETIADSQLFFPITAHVRQVDWHGKFTAAAGHAFYTARNYPQEYWNKVAFVTEPTGHLIAKFRVEAIGADFAAYNERSWLASDDEWCAPIMAEVGPDGNMWVIDWYNYIVQHNPTPAGFGTGKGNAYETPLRDKRHGRIYRVLFTGETDGKDTAASPSLREGKSDGSRESASSIRAVGSASSAQRGIEAVTANSALDQSNRDESHSLSPGERARVRGTETFSLQKASNAQLVATLKHPNQLWRLHAQRLLIERNQTGNELEEQLRALINDRTVDEIGLNVGAIHALWTLHGLDAFAKGSKLNQQSAIDALQHPSAGVRRAALMVLSGDEVPGIIVKKGLLKDPDAQVRMAAFLALADAKPDEAAGPAILQALKEESNANDRWIPNAATAAAAKNDASFIKAALASITPPEGTPRRQAINLLPNASFEEERDGRPLEWNTSTHSGRGELSLANVGRTGSRSAQISSTSGADISWSRRVTVEPNMNYRLSAWIKTENVRGAMGALLNVHELQGTQTVRTRPITGTRDWTLVETEFNSGDLRALTINCLFGGWGRSTGTAWFDDVSLVQQGENALPGALGTAVRIVTGHYAQRAPVESVVQTVLALRGASASLAVPLLDGLARNWPRENVPALTPDEEKKLAAVMTSLPEEARGPLLTLAERWGRKDIFAGEIAAIAKGLREQVANANLAPENRADAAKRLIALDDSVESVTAVLSQITTLSLPALSSGLINAVSESRLAQTAPAMINAFSKFTPAVRRSAIATLLRRPEWSAALLGAIDNGALQRTDLAAEHWTQLKSHPDRQIAARAAEIDKKPAGSGGDMEEVVNKLLPVAQRKGNAGRGRELFEQSCAVCHAFNGQGAKIGPDLTGIGARPRQDVLVDILDPNRSVEANYRLWNVTTKDGETYSGRLDSETQTSIDILDSAGQKHTVQRRDIEDLRASELSIMPGGFEHLPAEDLAALLEYLATSGHEEAKRQ